MWQPTNEFPDLKKAKLIALDLETCDPHLEENGPGGVRKDGFVIGFSVATDDGFEAYYPIKHSDGNVDNPDQAVAWLKDMVETDIPKVGANILYDCEWLKGDLGINVKGKKYDVQVAEPLLDENQITYRLDALAERYFGEHKEHSLLLEAGRSILGITGPDETVLKKTKGQLWRLPSKYVGPYGQKDASLPIRIFNKQIEKLKSESLWDVFLVETDILDLLLEMRFRGIPIDYDRGVIIRDQLSVEYDETMRAIKRRLGKGLNIWAAEEIAEACKTLGLSYLSTQKGNPSFEGNWLEFQENEFFKLIVKARKLDRGGSVFIEKKILNLAVNGRIHPQFWQVKTDGHGTVSGRFASSNPNMQQVPARDPVLSKLIRSIFIPEHGARWLVGDYSSQEPRVTVHYAGLCNFKGSDEAVNKYCTDPNTDYHQMVADMANITRKHAKTMNLGLSYGMGKKKLAEQLGMTLEQAEKLYTRYHQAVPFVKLLGDRTMRMASSRGYIKTLLGRRRHFNLYGPVKWSEGMRPKPLKEALDEFGPNVVRYFTHKALNALIQGSSADMLKLAMRDLYKAGYVPHITIHDELDFSVENDKQIDEIKTLMLNCVKLLVPLKVDMEIGPNWGECEAC